MAIDIYNNLRYDAPEDIEERYNVHSVAEAVQGGYKYPKDKTLYFSDDSALGEVSYPAGLYRYDGNNWVRVSVDDDSFVKVISAQRTVEDLLEVDDNVCLFADGRNHYSDWQDYVDEGWNIKPEFCVSKKGLLPPTREDLEILFDCDWTFDEESKIFELVNADGLRLKIKARDDMSNSIRLISRTRDELGGAWYCLYADYFIDEIDKKIVATPLSTGQMIFVWDEIVTIGDKNGRTLTFLGKKVSEVGSITDETDDNDIPSVKALKDYIEDHGGSFIGVECTAAQIESLTF